MKNNEISIICCLYNEIYIIKKKFSKVLKKIALKDFYKEILFIDNNSVDIIDIVLLVNQILG